MIFDRPDLPRRLLLIGGGPLGCELAQTFARLDVSVAIVERDPMFLSGEERDAAQILADALARDGVEIHLNTDILSVAAGDQGKTATLLSAGRISTVTRGRDRRGRGAPRQTSSRSASMRPASPIGTARASASTIGCARATQKCSRSATSAWRRNSRIAPKPSARLAVHNALLGADRRLSALIIPWCTYTDPEIAHVGLYVREARDRSIPVKTYTVLMQDVDRAVTDGEDEGFVKVHVEEGGDRILGATMVARHAGEMINALSLAINCEIGLRRVADVIHAYPTVAEAVKLAAEACVRELSGESLASAFKARRRAGEMA